MEYDVVVVGAGVMGSWTAYSLVERGFKTALLEQVGREGGRERGREGGREKN